jgi:hypothetical protein
MEEEVEVETGAPGDEEFVDVIPEEAPEDPAALRAELAQRDADLAAARQAAETAENRRRDTERWGNESNMRAIAADAALRAVAQQRQPEPRQPEPLQAPRFSQEDQEAIYTDPRLLEQKMQGMVDYGAQWTHRNLAPVIEQANQSATQARQEAWNANQALDIQTKLLAQYAIDRARGKAVAQGIPVEHFDRHLTGAYGLMQTASQGDGNRLRGMALDPDAIVMAVNMERQRNGVPVQRPAAPPTIGSRGNGAGSKAAPMKVPAPLAHAFAKLGVAVSPDDVKQYNEAAARAGRG